MKPFLEPGPATWKGGVNKVASFQYTFCVVATKLTAYLASIRFDQQKKNGKN